jgi:hypothetical protein
MKNIFFVGLVLLIVGSIGFAAEAGVHMRNQGDTGCQSFVYEEPTKKSGRALVSSQAATNSVQKSNLMIVESPDQYYPVIELNSIKEGVVVGTAATPGRALRQGVIYKDKVVTLVPTPDPNYMKVYFNAVDGNTAVGFANNHTYQGKGFIYQFANNHSYQNKKSMYQGVDISLIDPPFPYNSLIFRGISNDVIVGAVCNTIDLSVKGAISRNGVLSTIDSGDINFPLNAFYAISGEIIVGEAHNFGWSNGDGLIYQNGVITLVSSPDPSLPILAFLGINNGVIVGFARNADWTVQKGVIYREGVVTLMDSPDPNLPFLCFNSIENSGVVGEANSADWSETKGLVYQDGKILFLDGPNGDFPFLSLSNISGGVAVGTVFNSDYSERKGAIFSIKFNLGVL